MSNYEIPGIYVELSADTSSPLKSAAGTIAGFAGIADRGLIGRAQLVSSWSDYVDKYAYGLASPFSLNSDLGYSVYGYFQNGGKVCYISRVAHSTATKANLAIGSTAVVTATALEAGVWGNGVSIEVEANGSNFDLTVYSTLKGAEVVVEKYANLSNTQTSDTYYATIINANSRYISVNAGGTLVAKIKTALAGGIDGVSDIADTDYTDALSQFDSAQGLSMLAIPGKTSTTVQSALNTYSVGKKFIAIFDAPPSATLSDLRTLRATLSCERGCMAYPAVKVSDPLAGGVSRVTPISGHYAGVIARIVASRGVGKSPAGTEAVLKGVVDTVVALSDTDLKDLYEIRVNPVITKTDYGVVIWGDASIATDSRFKDLSAITLDNHIQSEIYNGTQWVAFEPHNEETWNKVATYVQAILTPIWKAGNLKGSKASEAFFVKCDAELNNAKAIEDGILYCQVGYARQKPAKYIVFTISQSVGN